MEAGAIPIDEQTIRDFQNNELPNNEGTESEGHDNTKYLEDVADWLLKTADTALGSYTESAGGTPEEVDKVKWDDESRQRVSELSVLVAKRNISEEKLKNTPELFLGSIVLGKVVEVGLVMNQIQKRQADPEPQQESETETEQDNE